MSKVRGRGRSAFRSKSTPDEKKWLKAHGFEPVVYEVDLWGWQFQLERLCRAWKASVYADSTVIETGSTPSEALERLVLCLQERRKEVLSSAKKYKFAVELIRELTIGEEKEGI